MSAFVYNAFLLLLLTVLCTANVEKTIFVAPAPEELPLDASIDNLLLPRLSVFKPSIRTYLNASFPTEDAPKGTETWLTLRDLVPGRRYEVRICWLATQPTSFWLYTRSMQTVFDSPELLSAVTAYSNIRHADVKTEELQGIQAESEAQKSSQKKGTSFLFLQIHAAADYYTLNKTLMNVVPPVHADIILDPYLMNIFPKSLLPTAGHIVMVAIFGWFFSSWIYRSFIISSTSAPESGAIHSKKSE